MKLMNKQTSLSSLGVHWGCVEGVEESKRVSLPRALKVNLKEDAGPEEPSESGSILAYVPSQMTLRECN